MKDLKNRLIALWARQQGLTTVEYAIAGTLIALAVVTAFTNLGIAVAAQIAAITGFL